MTKTPTLLATIASAAVAAAALAGPDIDESTSTQPDAGGVPQVAKVGKGTTTSSILRATGTTSTPSSAVIGGDIVDMFIVRVSNTATFSATTVGSADFDTMLYLCSVTLDASSQPSQAWIITGNDNASGTTTGSTVTFPSPSTAYGPGTYAIVVTTARTMPIGLNPSSTGGTPPTQTALLNYAATGLMTQTASGPDLPVKLWLPLGGALAAGRQLLGAADERHHDLAARRIGILRRDLLGQLLHGACHLARLRRLPVLPARVLARQRVLLDRVGRDVRGACRAELPVLPGHRTRLPGRPQRGRRGGRLGPRRDALALGHVQLTVRVSPDHRRPAAPRRPAPCLRRSPPAPSRGRPRRAWSARVRARTAAT